MAREPEVARWVLVAWPYNRLKLVTLDGEASAVARGAIVIAREDAALTGPTLTDAEQSNPRRIVDHGEQ